MQKHIQVEAHEIMAHNHVGIDRVKLGQEKSEERPLIGVDALWRQSVAAVQILYFLLHIEGPGLAFELPHRREREELALGIVGLGLDADLWVAQRGDHDDFVAALPLVHDGLEVQAHDGQRRAVWRTVGDLLDELGVRHTYLGLAPAEGRGHCLHILQTRPSASARTSKARLQANMQLFGGKWNGSFGGELH